ncbi:sensor domain-containing diguanylate cyclase [Sulfurimonas sp.]|nr:sensor domain-containing diguanylate cyclase [Sulfurimonas sp.]
MNRFEIISNSIKSTVIDREEILKLLYSAKHSKNDSSLIPIRKKIFNTIKPYFDDLKKFGVIITLFAFENNKTFLRMHKPSKFNDDLSKVRYSFKYVNSEKKIIRGLEEGKIMHAFRNIFPIFYKGEYLGAVDIAFSSEVLQRHMHNLYKTKAHFILNKSVFQTNIWKMKGMVNYIQSIEHEDFLHNVNSMNRNDSITKTELDLNYNLKDDIYKNIKHKNSFALEDSGQIVAFLPIKNIKDKKTIAYLVSYTESLYVKDSIKEYIVLNILFFVLFFIISLIVYISLKNRLLLNIGLEKEVEDQNKAFEIIFEKASDGIIIIEDQIINQCNEAIVSMIGYNDKNQLIGKSLSDISPKFQNEGVESDDEIERMLQNVKGDGLNNFEWKLSRVNKEDLWVGVTVTIIDIAGKSVIHALIKDITQLKIREEELLSEKILLDYKANHDVLTMLPNRALFTDRLQQSISISHRNKKSFALMFIDLDNFKPINDNLGHLVGDKVLQEVSARLKSVIREEDTLARLAGDEFVILMQNIKLESDASLLARNVINVLSDDISIDSNNVQVSASVGISIYPSDSVEPDELLKYADVAMYRAKENGRNNFKFYGH